MTPQCSRPPRFLLAACALFFGAAYFTVRFPDAPGAGRASFVSTLLIALPSFVALWRYLGPRRAVLSLLSLSAFGYAIETIGVATGFPYGPFYYEDSLGPKVAGLVPYLLPLSWVPLVLGTVAATALAVPEDEDVSRRRRVLWVLSAAVLLTLVDGVLDPGAASLGFWVWLDGGPYYGVPVSNYLGWLFSSSVAAAILLVLGRRRWESVPPPPGLLDSALVAVAFWVGVDLFSGLLFPAALGIALFFYLLGRRARLSSVKPAVAARSEAGYKHGEIGDERRSNT
ncbi:MAG: carotenoid biosynthesis protein [Actinobacteria bacterium]|nr:carotenoid biosynthesis protein [Actinomycetota bacterium]